MEAAAGAPEGAWARFVAWIHRHDESWLFVLLYIGFAVVLSVMLSLFWLVVMVGIHLAFEVVRHWRAFDRWPRVVSMATWEIRVDVMLLLLAFAVALYIEIIMEGLMGRWPGGGFLGAQSLGRAAVATSRVGPRAVAWQRAIRAVVLGFDDVANAIRAIFMKKSGESTEEEADPPPALETGKATPPAADPVDPAPPTPGWTQPWGFWDKANMTLCVLCLVAMVAAPPLTNSTYGRAVETIREELRPFPEQTPGLPDMNGGEAGGSEPEGRPGS